MEKIISILKCCDCGKEDVREKEFDGDSLFGREDYEDFLHDCWVQRTGEGWKNDLYNLSQKGYHLCPTCYKKIEKKVKAYEAKKDDRKLKNELWALLVQNKGRAFDKALKWSRKEYEKFVKETKNG